MKLRITVLPGDGIGPEVTKQAVNVLSAVSDVCGYEFRFEHHRIGGAAIEAEGKPLPERTLAACLEADAVLLGAVGDRKFDHLTGDMRCEAGLLALRQALGGFANLRPVRAYEPIADCSPLREEVIRDTDILIVRELLGGLYFGEPRELNEDGHAHNTMRYHKDEVERVAQIAFQEARRRKRRVTSVDKANVLETSQLWRRTVTEVAKQYPDVQLEHAYVDSFSMQLVTTPAHYDVVLTENLFGDILSDEAAVISGSLGMLASASVGGNAAPLYRRSVPRVRKDHAVGRSDAGAWSGHARSQRTPPSPASQYRGHRPSCCRVCQRPSADADGLPRSLKF